MQLFILGPAFGLPSIDAECNAAVALVQLRVGAEDYTLIPTHDQTHRLPYLIDGQASVSGFSNIARHLANKRLSTAEIHLSTTQKADALAITSFIEANAQTLLDISLYVGFDNYRLATRPAFTKILPAHANYIIPPRRRNAARTRTEHLGISSIDVDNVHEDMSNRPPGMEGVGKDPTFEAETQKRASLLLPQKATLRSLLQRPEHAAIFKLHALADNFFGPLVDMLDKEAYLLRSEEMHAVDCLVYGYMSLMLYPELPQDWLASTMRRKYPTLVSYVDRIHSRLGLTTDVDHVLSSTKDSTDASLKNLTLPWQQSIKPTISTSLREIKDGVLEQIPILGTSNHLHLYNAKTFPFLERNLQQILLSTTISLATMGYLALRTGLFIWPRGQDPHIFGQRRFADYGHLGAALAGVSFLGGKQG